MKSMEMPEAVKSEQEGEKLGTMVEKKGTIYSGEKAPEEIKEGIQEYLNEGDVLERVSVVPFPPNMIDEWGTEYTGSARVVRKNGEIVDFNFTKSSRFGLSVHKLGRGKLEAPDFDGRMDL